MYRHKVKKEPKRYNFGLSHANTPVKVFSTESVNEAIEMIKADPKRVEALSRLITSVWFKDKAEPEYKEKIQAIAAIVREKKLY